MRKQVSYKSQSNIGTHGGEGGTAIQSSEQQRTHRQSCVQTVNSENVTSWDFSASAENAEQELKTIDTERSTPLVTH